MYIHLLRYDHILVWVIKTFVHAGFVHLGEHGVEAVVLRQAADGFFHAANQLAFFRLVPALR